MTRKNLVIAAGALALGLASMMTPSKAQGPLYDKVMVNLPYTITIGGKTLQPGDYVIRQMDSPGGASRVLLIYSDNGMKFETSAMTIPTLDNRTPEDTKVVLHHFGQDYYFDKIWIQGKNYGYEFPLPDSVKAREKERMEPMAVAARYESVPAESNQTASSSTTTTQETTPAPAAQPTTPPPAENNNTTVAQNTTPAPARENTTVAQNTTPAPAATNTTTTAHREMPATAANWLMLLLGGGMLSGAGLTLRRKR